MAAHALSAIECFYASFVEIWTSVIGYEDLYEVSSFGRVRSRSREIYSRNHASRYVREGKILSCREDVYGYTNVDLCEDGSAKTVKVHRLQMIAFVGEPPFPDAEVDHRDGVRNHNRLCNLRWVTSQQNKWNRHVTRAASGVLNIRHRTDRPRPNPWQVYRTVNGKFKSLGHYPTRDAALKVQIEFREGLHFG